MKTILIARNKGFTLIEMSIALLIMSILAVASAAYFKALAEKTLAYKTAETVRMIYDGAYNYYIDKNAWPSSTATLISNHYLTAGANITSWGQPIRLTSGTTNNQLLLSFSVPSIKYVTLVKAHLPTPTITGLTITETLLPPGMQASLLALQDLAGKRAWQGDYNAGNHNLNNVNTVNVNTVNANTTTTNILKANTAEIKSLAATYTSTHSLKTLDNASIGSGCSTKQIGTTSNGTLASCVDGRWTESSGKKQTRIFTAVGGAAFWSSAVAACPSDYIITGGGGHCRGIDGGWVYLTTSRPQGSNAWYSSCDSTGHKRSINTTWAICMKK